MPRNRGLFDLAALLRPAEAFAHPLDVVNDADLTLCEKRAILSSWACDVCAIEAIAAPRQPQPPSSVSFDDIMHALRALDHQMPYKPQPHYRRVLEHRTPGMFGRKSDDDGRDQPRN